MIFESEVTISRIYRYTYVVRTVLKGHVACKFNQFNACADQCSVRTKITEYRYWNSYCEEFKRINFDKNIFLKCSQLRSVVLWSDDILIVQTIWTVNTRNLKPSETVYFLIELSIFSLIGGCWLPSNTLSSFLLLWRHHVYYVSMIAAQYEQYNPCQPVSASLNMFCN